MEHALEYEKEKHRKKRKIFDEKDYNIMNQMQQC